MSKVETKSISQVRNSLFSVAGKDAITTISRNGEFVGVLITCDFPNSLVASLSHKRLRENPVHTVTQLAKQVLG